MKKIIILSFVISLNITDNLYSATAIGSGSESVTIAIPCTVTATKMEFGTWNWNGGGTTITMNVDSDTPQSSSPDNATLVNGSQTARGTYTVECPTAVGSVKVTPSKVQDFKLSTNSSVSLTTSVNPTSQQNVTLNSSTGRYTGYVGGSFNLTTSSTTGSYTGSYKVDVAL